MCRLYTHVLNRHHWMYSATAYDNAYGDSGIFCINASAHPNQLADLVQVRSHVYLAFSLNSSAFCINASAHPNQGHRHILLSDLCIDEAWMCYKFLGSIAMTNSCLSAAKIFIWLCISRTFQHLFVILSLIQTFDQGFLIRYFIS